MGKSFFYTLGEQGAQPATEKTNQTTANTGTEVSAGRK